MRVIKANLAGIGVLISLAGATSCTADGPAGLLNLFAGGVKIVIENSTAYRATPRISTSSADNLIEEITSGSDSLGGIGQSGVVSPNQTGQASIACGDDIKVVIFEGASFESNGLPVGGVASVKRLERDKDFGCGDTIHIRLTGGLFSFRAEVEVERAISFNPFGGNSGNSEDSNIADVLDRLFSDL